MPLGLRFCCGHAWRQSRLDSFSGLPQKQRAHGRPANNYPSPSSSGWSGPTPSGAGRSVSADLKPSEFVAFMTRTDRSGREPLLSPISAAALLTPASRLVLTPKRGLVESIGQSSCRRTSSSSNASGPRVQLTRAQRGQGYVNCFGVVARKSLWCACEMLQISMTTWRRRWLRSCLRLQR